MWAYIVRRLLYTVPIVVGVLLVTFILFNLVPGDISAEIAGKNASQETIAEIRAELGWDKPLFLNLEAMEQRGVLGLFDAQLFHHYRRALMFDFGRSLKTKEPITRELASRAGPSLALTAPMFLIMLVVAVAISLGVAFVRGSSLDYTVVFICVLGMSVPFLAFILFGQAYLAFKAGWFPVYYDQRNFIVMNLALPVMIGVVAGLGGEVRFYRTVMLDEMKADYVRTAFAKGVSTPRVLFGHVLKNAMIPIITRVVLAIPFLFLGSLLLERFFGIPGLGDYMVNAIFGRDFAVVNAMTFIISLLFVLGNLAVDVCYALVDPRISLK